MEETVNNWLRIMNKKARLFYPQNRRAGARRKNRYRVEDWRFLSAASRATTMKNIMVIITKKDMVFSP
jgi:hypothetical protein